MDLLNLIHSEVFWHTLLGTVGGGLILAIILSASLRSFLKSLPSKIKSLITKVGSWDFSQRVLQNSKPIVHGQALDDYVQSFDEWRSEDSDGVTLAITRGNKTRTYYGVTKIRVSNKFPFDNAQDITIIHKKPGGDIASPSTIEFVIDQDVEKLAKKCYYQKIHGKKELKFRWSGHWYTNS